MEVADASHSAVCGKPRRNELRMGRARRPSACRREIEQLFKGKRPWEHVEGYQAGWHLDTLYRAVPGEVTLVTPAAPNGRSCSDDNGTEEDAHAVSRLAFEQAVRLAGRDRPHSKAKWRFSAFFDDGRPEEHFHFLQSFVTDVTWLFEHFSIKVVAPNDPIGGGCLDFDVPLPQDAPRGVLLVHGRSRHISEEDAHRLLRRAREQNVHVWIIRPWTQSGAPSSDLLEQVCDNIIAVRALDRCIPSHTCGMEVSIRKVRNKWAGLHTRGGEGPIASKVFLTLPLDTIKAKACRGNVPPTS